MSENDKMCFALCAKAADTDVDNSSSSCRRRRQHCSFRWDGYSYIWYNIFDSSLTFVAW